MSTLVSLTTFVRGQLC